MGRGRGVGAEFSPEHRGHTCSASVPSAHGAHRAVVCRLSPHIPELLHHPRSKQAGGGCGSAVPGLSGGGGGCGERRAGSLGSVLSAELFIIIWRPSRGACQAPSRSLLRRRIKAKVLWPLRQQLRLQEERGEGTGGPGCEPSEVRPP